MKIVKQKPTSPGKRFVSKLHKSEIYKGKPIKALVENKKSHGGRNNSGKITVRHRGGGNKNFYRIIDFKRNKINIPGIVERIEYDPNRSSNIALILYRDGVRKYIIHPKGLSIGDSIISSTHAPIKIGNCLPVRNIPVGSLIHCIELKPGKGAQIARSAGNSAQIIARENNYATLRLKSGEIRKILVECKAVIGEVGNSEKNLISIGKAGAVRWRGIRPTVRGVVMNPVDHPHGGGEGRTSGGRHPVTPWGFPTKGAKTRKNKRSQKLIIRSR